MHANTLVDALFNLSVNKKEAQNIQLVVLLCNLTLSSDETLKICLSKKIPLHKKPKKHGL